MREITLRAWDKLNKKMIYSFILTSKGEFLGLKDPMLPEGDDYGCINFELPSDVKIMLYTGLNDKNNKEIYNGDIVKCLQYNKKKIISKVIWSNENNRFEIINDNVDDFATMAQCSCFEIIGNIYENPELLNN